MAENLDSYRTLTPYLVVADADGEVRFLRAVFWATDVSCARNGAGSIVHGGYRVGDSLVMLGQNASAAEATSTAAPEDKPYGHRNAGVVEGNGLTWWIRSPCR